MWGMAVFVRSNGEKKTFIKYATGALKGEAIRFVETGGVFRGIDGCYSWFNSSADLVLDLSNDGSWTLNGPSADQRGRGIDLPSDRKWTLSLAKQEPSEDQHKRRFSVSQSSISYEPGAFPPSPLVLCFPMTKVVGKTGNTVRYLFVPPP